MNAPINVWKALHVLAIVGCVVMVSAQPPTPDALPRYGPNDPRSQPTPEKAREAAAKSDAAKKATPVEGGPVVRTTPKPKLMPVQVLWDQILDGRYTVSLIKIGARCYHVFQPMAGMPGSPTVVIAPCAP